MRDDQSYIIHQFIKFYGEILGLYLLGLILWTILFGCFYYWKEFLITIYKHKQFPSEGYISVLRDLRKYVTKMAVFTLLVILSLLVSTQISGSKEKVLFPSWITFLICFVVYNIYVFLYKKEEVWFVNDLKFMRNYYRSLYKDISYTKIKKE